MITIIAIIFLLLVLIACVLFIPVRANDGPERDAGKISGSYEAQCPTCPALKIGGKWTQAYYIIDSSPPLPQKQCPDCFIKQCQAKAADRHAIGRWSTPPGKDAFHRVPNSIS